MDVLRNTYQVLVCQETNLVLCQNWAARNTMSNRQPNFSACDRSWP